MMEYTVTEGRKEDMPNIQNEVVSNQHPVNSNVEDVFNELEALSYSISHDLRAPLRAIHNNCEWLSNRHSTSFNTKESYLLQQIMKSSEQMENLLDGLLEFSKLVKSTPKYSMINMTIIVQKVIDELLENEAASSTFIVKLHQLLPVYGDEILIRQVWYNFLSNAFKFTRYKERKEVEIESNFNNGEIVYYVRDNGVGFDMQYVNCLFGVFRRLHEIEEFEGTGVGLAIVKRIIERHGGRVWAEGKVDNGARFYFALPKT